MVARWEHPPPHIITTQQLGARSPSSQKNMKKLLHILLIAALFASCHQDEPINPTPEECPIQFGDVQTRAAVEDADDIDSFGVWAWINTGSEGEEGESNFIPLLDAEKVTRVTGGWDYVNTRYWVPERVFRFVGIYPFGAGTFTDGKITTDQITQGGVVYDRVMIDFVTPETADNDLLFATTVMPTKTPGVDYTNDGVDNPYNYPTAVDMNFQHALSKVTINVTPHETNVNDHFKIVSAKMTNITRNGTFGVASTGAALWIPSTGKMNFTRDYGEGKLLENEYGVDITEPVFDSKLLVPQSNLNNISLSIEYLYCHSTADSSLDASWQEKGGSLTFPAGEWVMGRSYVYTIVLTESNIIYIRTLDVDVPSWGEDGSGATIIIK